MTGNFHLACNYPARSLTLCGGDRKLDVFSAYLQVVAVAWPSCGRDS